ncbi:hypothetical protein EYF80_060135 [Liparis tanakae]|uniref:Uncharacterized protein n=1 Tax=Liparis tanakae TaxID=230148 RepID=A0A4Z2EL83_9TELE|nr:hypothetical protein EYF80_060135 [Liparis tanakae]
MIQTCVGREKDSNSGKTEQIKPRGVEPMTVGAVTVVTSSSEGGCERRYEMLVASPDGARFTPRGPSGSDDAHVLHFVLHASSIISCCRARFGSGRPDNGLSERGDADFR